MFDGVTQKAFYQKISMSVVEPRVKSQEGFPLKLKIQSMHVAASNNDIYIYIYIRPTPKCSKPVPPLIYISSSVSVFVSYLLHYKMDQNDDNYSKIFKYRSFYILYRTISRHFCPGNILYLIASRHFCPAIVVSISYIVQSQDISALEISFIL